jgi:hypothetical protein
MSRTKLARSANLDGAHVVSHEVAEDVRITYMPSSAASAAICSVLRQDVNLASVISHSKCFPTAWLCPVGWVESSRPLRCLPAQRMNRGFLQGFGS